MGPRMKGLKIFLMVVFLLCHLGFLASAQQPTDPYQELLEQSGAQNLREILPESVFEYFDEEDFNLNHPDWLDSLLSGNTVTRFLDLVTKSLKEPLRCGVLVAALLVLSVAFLSFLDEKNMITTTGYATVLCVVGVMAPLIFELLNVAVETVQSTAAFMLGFLPIFLGIVALSGAVTTAATSGGLLLGAATLLNNLASRFIVPMMGGYLAVSLCSGISPVFSKLRLADGLKRIAVWTLSLCGTLFAALLGFQSAIHTAADTVTVKTAKFFVGTTIPFAGPAISEALTTVNASVGLLKNSVGIYGVVVIAFLVLPILIRLLLWRFVLCVTAVLADFFEVNLISSILRATDQMFSLLVGVLLFSSVLFIICLAILVQAGKGL